MASESTSPPPATPEPDADQLLRMLELEMRQKKGRNAEHQRVSFRTWSIIFMVLAAAASLLVLNVMLSHLREDGTRLTEPVVPTESR